ncbi:MAG: hypothetical protein GXY83_27735 [Rhodopirellula sp.]|nr:hypothetical protein [Rhodopirellula sp.]
MPKNEPFWNPYRWVQLSDSPIQYAAPHYHHRLSGSSGRIWCDLEALTPLIIGDGRSGEVNFVRRAFDQMPYIPSTSLKGAIRSLAELIGNAAVPIHRSKVDDQHQVQMGARGSDSGWKLDIAARMFGFLNRGDVFAGLVQFSDGSLTDRSQDWRLWPTFKVAGGQPDPDHRPFYPDRKRRKLYHHQVNAVGLTPPHAGIREDQKRTIRPAPPGTRFTFQVDFANLRDEELNLLLYCLVLEERVEVTLSKLALGPSATAPITVTGPLRHKLGGCKPQGGGSVCFRVLKLLVRDDPTARYRGGSDPGVMEGEPLRRELERRTEALRTRRDDTMQQLRAMLIYAENDPRVKNMNYPSYQWFQDDKVTGSGMPLKPTT